LSADAGLDLLAIDAFTFAPSLETTCEICLREAGLGRRVGFVFLDIENVDQFPISMDHKFGSRIYSAARKNRLERVRAIEGILSANGVMVIPSVSRDRSTAEPSFENAGVDSLQALREFRPEGAALGIGVLSSLIRHTADSAPDFAANREVIERILTSACAAFDLTRELIEFWNPSTVLVFNGRFAVSKGIAEAARISQKEVLYHEIVSSKDRFYLSPSPIHHVHSTRKDLHESWASAGAGRESVAAKYFSTGRGGIELYEAPFLENQRSGHIVPPTGRRRIVYFVSSIDEYAAVEDGFENPLFSSQHSAVEWLVKWTAARSDTELVIRMHPRMTPLSVRESSWWRSLAAPNVTVLPPDSPVDSYELALSAARVVCFHSSMGAEATYLGIVSILIGDADYRGLDCVYEPATTGELEEVLQDPTVAPKPRENCLPFGYQRLMRGEEYRFYRPISFREGSFFGRRMTPDRKALLFRRIGPHVLYRLVKIRNRGIFAKRTTSSP